MGLEVGDVGEMRGYYENELRTVRVAGALEREIERSGVKNRAILEKLIDLGSVRVDEDGVHGISEQLDTLRESDPNLFAGVEEKPQTRINTGFSHSGTYADSDRLSDEDFYKRIKQI